MTRRISDRVVIALASLFTAAAMGYAPAAATESSAVPDLTGIWARSTFAIEPPPSGGPGPLRNPGNNTRDLPPAYLSTNVKPDVSKLLREKYESTLAGKPFPTPSSTCWPMVAPLIYRVQEMQLLQQKDQVTFIYMQDHEVRRVRLNASHPAKVTPSWHGDSVGHYEGDTLVIDTIGMKVGPVSIIDQAGTPYTEALHVIERYRLVDYETARAALEGNVTRNGPPGTRQAAGIDPNYQGKGLQVEFAVEDPNVFNAPWGGLATYGKADDLWIENVCAENTFEYYNNRDTTIPVAAELDF